MQTGGNGPPLGLIMASAHISGEPTRMYETIVTEVDEGIGILTLNRADKHNVLDRTLVEEMTAALTALDTDPRVRVLVLSANGKSFCAGVDPAWVRDSIDATAGQREQDNRRLANLLATLSGLGKPSIARVQGSASGIGVGLVAACDIVLATYDVSFAINEARSGLLPAIASPYLAAALGERHFRYFMLTAERFSATEAYRLGLVHEMVPGDEQLDEAIGEMVDLLLRSGPAAMTAGKALLREIGRPTLPTLPCDAAIIDATVRHATAVQGSGEGRQGMLALIEKRRPDWAWPEKEDEQA